MGLCRQKYPTWGNTLRHLRSLLLPVLLVLLHVLPPHGASLASAEPLPSATFVNSGLVVWLDASDGSSLFQDGGATIPAVDQSPVSLWRDLSGNNNHLTQPVGALRPALSSTSHAQNFLSGVHFDGVDDFMHGTSGLGIGSDFTLLLVSRVITPSSANDKSFVVLGDRSTDAQISFIAYPFNYNETNFGMRSPFNDRETTPAVNLSSLPFNLFAATLNGSDPTVYLNAHPYPLTSLNGGFQFSNDMEIGRSSPFAYETGFTNVVVYELLLYNRALNATEMGEMQAYLDGKWLTYSTATPTPSSTPTVTPTSTSTLTPTPSATSSPTPTPTCTYTPTHTPSRTATPSATATRTATNSPTPSDTPTTSPTDTPEDTPTPQDTETPDPLSTPTPTDTPENTPTTSPFDPTPTPTPLPVPGDIDDNLSPDTAFLNADGALDILLNVGENQALVTLATPFAAAGVGQAAESDAWGIVTVTRSGGVDLWSYVDFLSRTSEPLAEVQAAGTPVVGCFVDSDLIPTSALTGTRGLYLRSFIPRAPDIITQLSRSALMPRCSQPIGGTSAVYFAEAPIRGRITRVTAKNRAGATILRAPRLPRRFVMHGFALVSRTASPVPSVMIFGRRGQAPCAYLLNRAGAWVELTLPLTQQQRINDAAGVATSTATYVVLQVSEAGQGALSYRTIRIDRDLL